MKRRMLIGWAMAGLMVGLVVVSLRAANLTFANLAPQDAGETYLVLQQKTLAAINANTIARAQIGGVTTGTGTPEAVVTSVVGKLYLDTAGRVFYVKLTGSGNTGWALVTAF